MYFVLLISEKLILMLIAAISFTVDIFRLCLHCSVLLLKLNYFSHVHWVIYYETIVLDNLTSGIMIIIVTCVETDPDIR